MDFRRKPRVEVFATCKCRSGTGMAHSLLVEDLSEDGCRLVGASLPFRSGSLVSLRIGAVGPIEGRIKWIKPHQCAGVEFSQPLYPAVFTHMVASMVELENDQSPDLITASPNRQAETIKPIRSV